MKSTPDWKFILPFFAAFAVFVFSAARPGRDKAGSDFFLLHCRIDWDSLHACQRELPFSGAWGFERLYTVKRRYSDGEVKQRREN